MLTMCCVLCSVSYMNGVTCFWAAFNHIHNASPFLTYFTVYILTSGIVYFGLFLIQGFLNFIFIVDMLEPRNKIYVQTFYVAFSTKNVLLHCAATWQTHQVTNTCDLHDSWLVYHLSCCLLELLSSKWQVCVLFVYGLHWCQYCWLGGMPQYLVMEEHSGFLGCQNYNLWWLILWENYMI